MIKNFCALFFVMVVSAGLAQENDTIELKALNIKGQSQSQKLIKTPIKIQVIDTEASKYTPVNLNQLINNTSGVRLRQSGGLGSSVSIQLNGFKGNSVRYLKDGIPTDYLGSIYNLSSVPVNSIQRLEIYKGMLPADLGADALGGAINIVTQENAMHSFLNVAADIGSYNTQRYSLNGKWVNSTKSIYISGAGFYNHSDNDYNVIAPIVDKETSNVIQEEVSLFHNQFTNYYAELNLGIINKTWADDLRFTLTGYHIKRNYNYGNTMVNAYGGVHSMMKSIVPSIRYKKKIFNNKLRIDQFFTYNTINRNLTDTVAGKYDWNGNFTPIPERGGETKFNGSLLNTDRINFISRTNIQYRINGENKIIYNSVYNDMSRQGSNPFGDKLPISGKDVLSEETNYSKWVHALGLDSKIFQNKISHQFLVKYFYLKTDGIDTYKTSPTEERTTQEISKWGVGDAIKYNFRPNFYSRISAEYTTRLPDQNEFLGNGAFILPNLQLRAERSLNFNWGVHYEYNQKWFAEINLFYRKTEDMIRLINNGFFNFYKNTENVKGTGLEWDVTYHPFLFLKLNGNLTYQNFRLYGQKDKTYRDARLPNTPYFFANFGIDFHFKNAFIPKDQLKVYWIFNYVKSFYTAYVPKKMEPDGFLGLWGNPKVDISDVIVPEQNLYSCGFTWLPNKTWAIGVGVSNIFDAEVYDNFKIQNAGRSFNLKINYTLKN